MTAATTRSRAPAAEHQPPVSKVLTDRIQADGEQVAHTLDPDREPDTVRYPDPHAPHTRDEVEATSVESNAEIQMARRTDAGPGDVARASLAGRGSNWLLWGVGAAGLVLAILVLIALV